MYDSPEERAKDLERQFEEIRANTIRMLLSGLLDDNVSADAFEKLLDEIFDFDSEKGKQREEMARSYFEAQLSTKYEESFVEMVMAYADRAQEDQRPTKQHIFPLLVQHIHNGQWGREEIVSFIAENPL